MSTCSKPVLAVIALDIFQNWYAICKVAKVVHRIWSDNIMHTSYLQRHSHIHKQVHAPHMLSVCCIYFILYDIYIF